MTNLLIRIIGDKKDWRAMEARAKVLPRDYRVVYGEMKSYMWKCTTGDGLDVIAVLREVLGLFESSSSRGENVREVTGEDIAAFCDERLRSTSPSYRDKWRASLNRDVARKLAE